MPLKIYNTLTKKKEVFEPLSASEVKMYVCGITPYDETHLGHARAYVTFDIVKRYLEYSDYKVKHVQNITDIDDKIIKKAREEGCGTRDVAEKYTQAYFEVVDKLNVKRADIYPKATETIKDMITWIEKLVEKGVAYVINGDVYFEVEKFKTYGKLSKRKKKDMQAGVRVEVDKRKKNPLDFALWKAAKEGEPSWDSPWGKGRPGWHIECSVMSSKYLGEQFDIHGGGLDLIFPHHENEIAQTEALTGKSPWVKYWIHNGFVNVDKQKMSKSLGNFFTLKDIYKKYDPMVVRMFLLSAHYRSPLNFSDKQLKEAETAYKKLVKQIKDIDFLISKVKEPEAEVEVEVTEDELADIRGKFETAMDDDFNTAAAIAVVFDLVHLINEDIKEEKIDKRSLLEDKELLLELCRVLGLKVVSRKLLVVSSGKIEKLIAEREEARKKKDFKKSDQIRDRLLEMGIIIEDTAYGTRWTKS